MDHVDKLTILRQYLALFTSVTVDIPVDTVEDTAYFPHFALNVPLFSHTDVYSDFLLKTGG